MNTVMCDLTVRIKSICFICRACTTEVLWMNRKQGFPNSLSAHVEYFVCAPPLQEFVTHFSVKTFYLALCIILNLKASFRLSVHNVQ